MRKPTTKSASATVSEFVRTSKARMQAVTKQSIQDLIEEIQTPTAKGGRMRIDTGFLRASGQASLSGMPTGPSRPSSEEPTFYDDGSEPVPDVVVLTIARFTIGGQLWFGWTANYARYREAHDGFLRLGVQNWQTIVDKNVRLMKQRIKDQKK